jgi:hypothetical protein
VNRPTHIAVAHLDFSSSAKEACLSLITGPRGERATAPRAGRQRLGKATLPRASANPVKILEVVHTPCLNTTMEGAVL